MGKQDARPQKKKRGEESSDDDGAGKAQEDGSRPAKRPTPAGGAAAANGHRSGPPAAAARGNGQLPGPAASTGAHAEQEYELFLKYLPYETTEEELGSFFSRYGTLARPAVLLKDFNTGKCKGVGWVAYSDEGAMKRALAADGVAFGGRHLSITVATKKQGAGIKGTVQEPGTHTPALLAEVLRDVVGSDRDGVFVDATFGRGGHSRAILARLGPKGRLHAFDMDPAAIAVGRQLEKDDRRFKIHHAPFSTMAEVLDEGSVTGILFDLGISSPQFDEAGRGFRPEQDGPLDLRFDQTKGESAYELLQRIPRDELARILTEYGDGQDRIAAQRIADAICLQREQEGGLPSRTREFAALVAAAKGREYQAMHPAKLTFQALRIHLNDEFGEMRRGMAAAFACLGEGGRMGLITWKHSECAILLEFFREREACRPECPMLKWWEARKERRVAQGKAGKRLREGPGLFMDAPSRPTEAELRLNSRSRSAVLHILRKQTGVTVRALEAAVYKAKKWGPAPAEQANEGAAGGESAAVAEEEAGE